VPATLTGNFTDPKLPSGYGPFGIQNINGQIYVAYAKQDADAEDEIAGQGRGIVDEFSADGQFVRRFAQHGQLNAPWGIALPRPTSAASAMRCSSVTSAMAASMRSTSSPANCWDLCAGRTTSGSSSMGSGGSHSETGNLARSQPQNVLFFAAGPNDEQDGLYGRIEASGRGLVSLRLRTEQSHDLRCHPGRAALPARPAAASVPILRWAMTTSLRRSSSRIRRLFHAAGIDRPGLIELAGRQLAVLVGVSALKGRVESLSCAASSLLT
jgi:hypothetical protein